MRGIASKQLHALCYEHHVKMGMTGLVKQTAYACPKPDCSVRYSPSNGYFLAPEHGQVESYLTPRVTRSEEHTSELQSRLHLVCRLLLEKKKKTTYSSHICTKKSNNRY